MISHWYKGWPRRLESLRSAVHLDDAEHTTGAGGHGYAQVPPRLGSLPAPSARNWRDSAFLPLGPNRVTPAYGER